MAFNSNYRFDPIQGANAVTITNEAQVVVDLSYMAAGRRGVLLSEAPLKESPSTIVMVVGGTTFTEVDISAFTGAANTFAVDYASNSGVVFVPPGTALGTATTTTYKGLGSVATIESKRYNPDGLVTAPSVSFENDPDTGMYRIGANNMGFAAGGVQTSELNSLGILNGTLGTELRNILQIRTISVAGGSTGNITNVNTWMDFGLSNSITLKSASSQVLIISQTTSQMNTNSGNYLIEGHFARSTAFTGVFATPVSINTLTPIRQITGNYSYTNVPSNVSISTIHSFHSHGQAAGTTYYYAYGVKADSFANASRALFSQQAADRHTLTLIEVL